MATKTLVSGTVVNADDSAANSTIAMRDANGDLWAVSHRSSGPIRGSQSEYMGVSALKTANFSATDASRFWPCDAAAGTITATLPAVASSAGLRLTFKKTTATNNLIVKGLGAELIDGANTKTATGTQWNSLTLYCDGVAWFIESSLGTWT